MKDNKINPSIILLFLILKMRKSILILRANVYGRQHIATVSSKKSTTFQNKNRNTTTFTTYTNPQHHTTQQHSQPTQIHNITQHNNTHDLYKYTTLCNTTTFTTYTNPQHYTSQQHPQPIQIHSITQNNNIQLYV